jgi:hypothetical protein
VFLGARKERKKRGEKKQWPYEGGPHVGEEVSQYRRTTKAKRSGVLAHGITCSLYFEIYI